MSLGKKKMLSQGGAGALVPSDNFNTVLWTGNNTARTIPVGFQPDLIWLKNRNNNGNSSHRHLWYDSIRGLSYIHSDGTSAQEAYPAVTGFVSTGFSLGGGAVGGSDSGMNDGSGSGGTYVGWCWYAPTSETNTSGDINSTIKKNVDAGFSIVTYSGATNATTDTSNNSGNYWGIGHGLSAAPELIIVKKTNGLGSWYVGSSALGNWTSSQHLVLNETSEQVTRSGATQQILWGNTAPTSTLFEVGGWDVVNRNGDSYVAYCFHSVAGYQKVGSYAGNGTTQTIDVGFTPRFVMIKAFTNSSAFTSWAMFDNQRLTSYDDTNPLYANLTAQEGTRGNGSGDGDVLEITFVANTGFKLGDASRNNGSDELNDGNNNYLYLAIA